MEIAEVGKPGETWLLDGKQVGRNQVVAWCLEQIADGEALTDLCEAPGMPSVGMVLGWIRYNPEWKKRLAEAEECRATVLAERALKRAKRSGANQTMVEQKGDELFVKTAQWMAERLDRKKFGEKVATEDLGRELAMATEDQLMARIVAAVVAVPAMLEKIAPKLKSVLPPERLEEIQQAALAARQAGSVEGEVVDA